MRHAALFLLCLALSGPSLGQAVDEDQDGPTIEHERVTIGIASEPVLIVATFSDPNGVFEPAVLYRVGSEGSFMNTPMEETDEPGVYAATIPGKIVVADLEYFIEAFDELGNGPTRTGDAELPLSIRVVTRGEDLPDQRPPGGQKDPQATDPAAPASPGEGDEAESEGSGLGLWLGLGGAAGGALLVVAAAAAAGVAGYFFLNQGPNNTSPSEVNVTLTSPSPTALALTSAAP